MLNPGNLIFDYLQIIYCPCCLPPAVEINESNNHTNANVHFTVKDPPMMKRKSYIEKKKNIQQFNLVRSKGIKKVLVL